MWPNPEKTADLETLTEKFHFFVQWNQNRKIEANQRILFRLPENQSHNIKCRMKQNILEQDFDLPVDFYEQAKWL